MISHPTNIYWIEYAPGKFAQRTKEPLKKVSFTNQLNNLYKAIKGKKK